MDPNSDAGSYYDERTRSYEYVENSDFSTGYYNQFFSQSWQESTAQPGGDPYNSDACYQTYGTEACQQAPHQPTDEPAEGAIPPHENAAEENAGEDDVEGGQNQNPGMQFQSDDDYPDLTDEFICTESFASRALLLARVRQIAAMRNVTLIIQSSKSRRGNTLGYTTITCHLYGPPRNTTPTEVRNSTTKKCWCGFRLHATPSKDGTWTWKVIHGRHNHDLPTYPVGQPLGKLNQAELSTARDANQSGLRGNKILRLLQRVDDSNASTQQHVRNAILKFTADEREGRSPLQHFLKLLHDHHYYSAIQKNKETHVVADMFFTHPKVPDILKSYPYVMLGTCIW